jgi:hypothetical protein
LGGNTINALGDPPPLDDDNDRDKEDEEARTAGVLLLLLLLLLAVAEDVDVVVDAVDEEDSLDFKLLLRRVGGGDCVSSSGSTGCAMMMGDR